MQFLVMTIMGQRSSAFAKHAGWKSRTICLLSMLYAWLALIVRNATVILYRNPDGIRNTDGFKISARIYWMFMILISFSFY